MRSDNYCRAAAHREWAQAVALAIALLVPDTMELTGYREGDAQSDWRRDIGVLAWRPSMAWFGATAVLLILSATLSEADFLSWGWRVGFWLSVIIVGIGYYIRTHVSDSPIFKAAREQAEREAAAGAESLHGARGIRIAPPDDRLLAGGHESRESHSLCLPARSSSVRLHRRWTA